MSAVLLVAAGVGILWLALFALASLGEDAWTGFVVANVVVFGIPGVIAAVLGAFYLILSGLGAL